ncbi:MAG: undecaprenyl/decaprenyl-phosphate alpha-N-acetylglucosaminyl 1-phosphate transferase [Phycisphaerales bacterium]|nr:MAG: undecaprenyl/decaprenyl-phosphate alpha-N-acetylglucosaminyl 1-phosphate transferase [Phycisphaerales bacterium]
MTTYFAVFLGSLTLALLLTPLVIRVARRMKVLDRPGIRTVHTNPIPRIGGVAIFLSAMCLIVAVCFRDNDIGAAFRQNPIQLSVLLSTATFIFVVGLIDDVRGLPARVKLLAEVVAAGLLCYVGVRISALDLTDSIHLGFGPLTCPLTILWIIGITNAVNLSDGLDGLAAGVSAVACAAIAIFAVSSGNMIMAVFMLALLGGLSGFLFYNFNPAKIFMGDCGSLFVGFTIASASAMCLTKSCALVGLALPTLALGIPIFDTFFAILRRFLERRSLFAPDRSHFHHHLIDLGLKQKHAVITIYVATCMATGLGLFMMVRQDAGALVVFGCLLFLLTLLFRVVGDVHIGATFLALQKKYVVACREKQERRAFEDLQLRFRRARNPKEWWQAVCDAGAGLNFAWVSLTASDAGGQLETKIWRGTRAIPEKPRIVTMSFPVRDSTTETLLEFEIAIVTEESLESAGRRGALFSRLVDEYGLVSEAVAGCRSSRSKEQNPPRQVARVFETKARAVH